MTDHRAAHWRPHATRQMLVHRAALLAQIREFFAARQVLEVETPQLSAAAGTDPNIASLPVTLADGCTRFLHTSPEFAMKRLLAAGSGDIFQLCKVFRDGERGRYHNPEFTLAEWYRLGFDHHQLMDEVGALLAHLSQQRWGHSQRLAFFDVLYAQTQLDPLSVSSNALRQVLQRHDVAVPQTLDAAGGPGTRDELMDLVVGEVIGPRLGHDRPCFVYDYPASRASLARIRQPASEAQQRERRPQPAAVAERFELYINGVELANGFHELTDPREQAQRFAEENAARARDALPPMPIDTALIGALRSGLAPCAGVALGVDRLMMLLHEVPHIEQTLSFGIDRA